MFIIMECMSDIHDMKRIRIGKRIIGLNYPTYVIAEVGSNFDGSLRRAKDLAVLAKKIGADCYKIQNFLAPKIVSETGFKNLKISFQTKWPKSVVEVYKAAEFPREWLGELSSHCKKVGIDFISSPYDREAVDALEKVRVPAYKIGSGEIDNLPLLSYIAQKHKPVILACGASTLEEIKNAVHAIEKTGNKKIVILQCITNYPSPIEHANLKVLKTLKDSFPYPVGYSDHTIGVAGGGNDPLDGITIPLAAVAMGARVIEKHFTDDRKRNGPDHPFAVEPKEFEMMVKGIRAVESALGGNVKKVTSAEKETYVIQRRGIYARVDIAKGEEFREEALEFLRPALGLRPARIADVIGKKARRNIKAGEPIVPNAVRWS